MSTAKGRAKAKAVAWWLSSGTEECPHCGRLYAYEIEFRCSDCDGPSCPQCKQQHADDRFLCLTCIDDCSETEGRTGG